MEAPQARMDIRLELEDGAMAQQRTVETERKFVVVGDIADGAPYICNDPAAWELRQAYLALPHGPGEAEIRLRAKRRIAYPLPVAGPAQPWCDENGEEVATTFQLGAKRDIPTDESGGLSRREEEVPLREADFNALWRLTEGRRLLKTRIEFLIDLPVGGPRVVTVDLFAGRLQGLRLAEIEFGDWTDSTAFRPPGFLGHEVTHDRRYRNAALALAERPPLDDLSTPDVDL